MNYSKEYELLDSIVSFIYVVAINFLFINHRWNQRANVSHRYLWTPPNGIIAAWLEGLLIDFILDIIYFLMLLFVIQRMLKFISL